MSIASSERLFTAGGRTAALRVVRSGRARRARLAIDPASGAVRLTLPARASLSQALRWIDAKRGWIEATLAALPTPHAMVPGAWLPFRGVEIEIVPDPAMGRGVVADGARLLVGGPPEHLSARLHRWLRTEALSALDAETRACAARADIKVGRVGVGDPRSRWGSCTATGDIRYSWRLILAPPDVLEATVAHEVAHRLHMDHSPAFHRAVAALLGRDPVAERAWLRANGARLQAIGRG